LTTFLPKVRASDQPSPASPPSIVNLHHSVSREKIVRIRKNQVYV